MRTLPRIALSVAAGTVALLLAAVVLALIDLYLTGLGYASIRSEHITWDPGGIHLSVADVCVLAVFAISTVFVWRQLRASTK
jgi:hypothetical protein